MKNHTNRKTLKLAYIQAKNRRTALKMDMFLKLGVMPTFFGDFPSFHTWKK